MANNSHTAVICSAALRQDTNNMWRGLKNSLNISYDASPVNSLPGLHGIALAVTLNAVEPWKTTPTHWMASAWELPEFEVLINTLRAGNIPTRDWLPFNLTQTRARTAGQNLYSRTVAWTGAETDPDASLQRWELQSANIAAALSEHPNGPLVYVPHMTRPV